MLESKNLFFVLHHHKIEKVKMKLKIKRTSVEERKRIEWS